MLVVPNRRKVLKYKKMKEVGLDPDQLQILFIIDNTNLYLYKEVLNNFDNQCVKINIVSLIELNTINDNFSYFSPDDLDWLYEICNFSFPTKDDRILSYDLVIINSVFELNRLKPHFIESKNDEVSVILSHANTEEKKEVLVECIDALKRLGQKIILASHIGVDDAILQLVDYFVYDKENRLIGPEEFDGAARTWAYCNLEGYYHEFNYPNHALAVLDLMKIACGLATSKGYRVTHLIHYDCIIYDEILLSNHYKFIDDYDIYHYHYSLYPNRMDGNFFSVDPDKFLNLVKGINSKEDFCNFNFGIFESFLKQICYDSKYKIKSCVIESLFYKNIIDKIKMLQLQIEKEYENYVTHSYAILSKDKDNKYIAIYTNDVYVETVLINNNRYNVKPHVANIFLINDEIIDSGINVHFPYLDYKQNLTENIKFADCLYCDINKVNFYDLTSKL